MTTAHTETVVDKALNKVKEFFGGPTDEAPEVRANPEYTDTPTETAAEDAMRVDPNVYEGLVPPESRPLFKTEAEAERERLRVEENDELRRRRVGQYPDRTD
jgi:hypothetical protein